MSFFLPSNPQHKGKRPKNKTTQGSASLFHRILTLAVRHTLGT